MKNKKALLLILLLLGVGFAAVSTTLLMTENVNISTNNDDFDVRFTRAVLSGDGVSAVISDDGKTITYSTGMSHYGVLTKVGDTSTLNFEVTNNSEMYDAEVSVVCSATGPKSDYYQISSEVVTPIVADTTESGTLSIRLLKSSAEDINETFSCTLNVTAKERTRRAVVYYAFGDPTIPSGRTTDYTSLKYPYIDGNPSAEGKSANVFVKLASDGVQKSVCLIKDGSLKCFDPGYDARSQVEKAFRGANCSYRSGLYQCYTSDFAGCYVWDSGSVRCDDGTGMRCYVGTDGTVECDG